MAKTQGSFGHSECSKASLLKILIPSQDLQLTLLNFVIMCHAEFSQSYINHVLQCIYLSYCIYSKSIYHYILSMSDTLLKSFMSQSSVII